MANAVIATPLLSDAATITAGAEVASMPALNLQTRQPGEVWRCTDLANSYLVIDLLAAAAINLIWLGYTNASSTATVRVRGATSIPNLTGAPGYDSGSLSHWPTTGLDTWDWTHFFLWLSNAQNYLHWRIDVSDPTNPAGYYQAGRLYLDAAWQVGPVNVNWGWNIGFAAGTAQSDRGAGGQVYPVDEVTPRIVNFELAGSTEAELMAHAFDLDRRRRTSKDLLAIRDPSVATYLMQESIYGHMTARPPIIAPAFGIFTKQFQIEEFLP